MNDDTAGSNRRSVLAMAAIAAAIPWASVSQAAEGRLHVIAELVATPGNEEMLRHALIGFAKGAPKEPGCLSYRLLEDQAKPGRFLTYEEWASDSALMAHLTSPAMKAALPTLTKILAQPFALTKLTLLV